MKKILLTLLPMTLIFTCPIKGQETAFRPVSKNETNPTKEEESFVFFTPPSGWFLADPNSLPTHVRVMVVGKQSSTLPPRLNLSWEPYKGTLKQYLKTVKNMNAAQGYEWKDLGAIQTQAGTGSFSQVDMKTQWGDLRLMHVILIKNGNVYILTASALKDEFSIFYKEFFDAMHSLRIVKDMYEMVTPPQQRTQLKTAAHKLQAQWETLLLQKQKENSQVNGIELRENVFNSEEFQNAIWNPFREMLKQHSNQLGAEWQSLFLQKLEDQLLSMNLNQKYSMTTYSKEDAYVYA